MQTCLRNERREGDREGERELAGRTKVDGNVALVEQTAGGETAGKQTVVLLTFEEALTLRQSPAAGEAIVPLDPRAQLLRV